MVLKVSELLRKLSYMKKRFPPMSCRFRLFGSVTDWTYSVIISTLAVIKGRCEGKAGVALASAGSSLNFA